MFSIRGVLATIGAKNFIYLGDNISLKTRLKEYSLNLVCFDELPPLSSLNKYHDYAVIIEDSVIAENLDNFHTFFFGLCVKCACSH